MHCSWKLNKKNYFFILPPFIILFFFFFLFLLFHICLNSQLSPLTSLSHHRRPTRSSTSPTMVDICIDLCGGYSGWWIWFDLCSRCRVCVGFCNGCDGFWWWVHWLMGLCIFFYICAVPMVVSDGECSGGWFGSTMVWVWWWFLCLLVLSLLYLDQLPLGIKSMHRRNWVMIWLVCDD